jgi:hypothetical protein
MDILNHFIDFMTYEMRWGTPLLGITIELIFHIQTGVSLEYSVNVPYTLVFVTHLNTESLFL